MANPIERAARAIRSRLAGLVGEQQQLQQALAALEGLLRSERGKAAQPPARKTGRRRPALRASTSASTPPRRRRRPSRADQFLALVAERPGITVAEAAERLNASGQTLYNVSARLQREGQLRKDGPSPQSSPGQRRRQYGQRSRSRAAGRTDPTSAPPSSSSTSSMTAR